jgi:hypothetical protein
MKVGQPPPATLPPLKGLGPVVLSGPGFAVNQMGALFVLRALPALTGRGVVELRLEEAEVTALIRGETSVKELLQLDTASGGSAGASQGTFDGGGETSVRLSDAAQEGLQAGLIRDPAAQRPRDTGRGAGPKPRPVTKYNHSLTLAALAFALVVAVIIAMGIGR